ncbi:MAG TPA: hypothetical protein VNJ01_09710 [Bacteriovoracaceae bacterium]|nr:hypothetical protein [Bacteriovoracaceae bacterium]
MKLLQLITTFHNWLADKDFIWWPFSFLRPEKTEFITFQLSLLMTLCFGGLAFVMFTVLAVVNNAFTAKDAVITFLVCVFGFLGWFNGVTKPLWNRRVRELRE